MSDMLRHFIDACMTANVSAGGGGYPPFTAGFRGETPLNSAPYVFDQLGFRTTFGTSARRRRIIANCQAALDALKRGGVICQMLLIGGSFIRSGDSPSDLDGLVLYSVDPAAPDGIDGTLTGTARSARSADVDLKFCPMDAHPIVLVKRLIFFSNVFSYDRETKALLHGTVILMPDGAAGSTSRSSTA